MYLVAAVRILVILLKYRLILVKTFVILFRLQNHTLTHLLNIHIFGHSTASSNAKKVPTIATLSQILLEISLYPL